MSRYCLITNDVETTSVLRHCLSDDVAQYLLTQGMPRLLDLYEQYGVKATFFFTGHIAEICPELVKMAHAKGHEIGSHGLTHEVSQAIDTLSYKEQVRHLKESKAILEGIIGEEVVSFRSPAARVNKTFPMAMQEAGFKIDSSVSSQRMDMFMSFGVANKMNWLIAPRKAYFVDENNIFRKGKSDILEVPISALVLPYIGTFMRISPGLNRMTRNLLFLETKMSGRQFTFLTHPNEFIDETDTQQGKVQRRSSNYISYLLGDVLRHKMKVKNLGGKALPIYERELQFFQKHAFDFVTCKDFYVMKTNGLQL